MRTWILFEAENVAVHLPADVRIELADVPFGGGSDFNAVGQDSVPKFPHKVTECDGPLFFRFRQSCAGVFQVDSVHFLLGQTLQQTEVFYRDDGGQVLPTAGDNCPLLSVGGAVYDVRKLCPRFRDIKTCHGGVPLVQSVRVHNQYRRKLPGFARRKSQGAASPAPTVFSAPSASKRIPQTPSDPAPQTQRSVSATI